MVLLRKPACSAWCAIVSVTPDESSSAVLIVGSQNGPMVWNGATIPAGAQLQLLYAAGNRDAKEFPGPETFQMERPNAAGHLAFGGGEHFCLGAALARLEGRIALEVLGARLPDLRLAPEQSLDHVPHFFLRGFEHVWVEWTPAG